MKKLLLFVVLLLMVAYWRNELLYVLQINRLNTLSAQQRQKIWVHRVNSIERMHWVKDDFKGIEFDMYFDVKKKEFTVAHPPEDTAGPSLSAFFRELCYTNLFGWVDVKALKKEDLQEALAALEKLKPFCSVSNRLLFEVYDPALVPAFEKAGYRVLLNNSAIVHSYPLISGESTLFGELKKKYPVSKLFIWELSWKNYLNLRNFQQLTNNEQVEILLVNIKSPGYE